MYRVLLLFIIVYVSLSRLDVQNAWLEGGKRDLLLGSLCVDFVERGQRADQELKICVPVLEFEETWIEQN